MKTALAVAVLRGYEARDPITARPMCADIEAVRAAISRGLGHPWHRLRPRSPSLRLLRGLPQAAEPLGGPGGRRGRRPLRRALLRPCLRRRPHRRHPRRRGLLAPSRGAAHVRLEPGPAERASPRSRRSYERATSDAADLLDLSAKVTRAVGACGLGLLTARALRACGLDEADCRLASALEKKAICDPGLFPGMPADQRRSALAIAMRNEAIRCACRGVGSFCRATQDRTGGPVAGAARRTPPGPRREADPHHTAGKPVLHLDATLRPELARTVLPRLGWKRSRRQRRSWR